MKLRRSFFCITDNYNKPDFRYLFENRKDVEKRILKIKRSIKGETMFLSQHKRDFFVDGVKNNIQKPITTKEGCWTTLKTKKLSLLCDIKPELLFKKIKHSRERASSLLKQRVYDSSVFYPAQTRKQKKTSFLEFDWQSSIFRTKAFALTFSFAIFITFGTVFIMNHNTTRKINKILTEAQALQTKKIIVAQTYALKNKNNTISQQFDEELSKLVLETLNNFENLKIEELEQEIRKIVVGSPMEKMAPLIAKQDRRVAAFLVGIAKKESNFGRRVPVLNGEDCFNYWGYRGIRSRMGSGGHTCFDNPEDAIETVGGRLGQLVNADVDTPQEMVLWKCGSGCHKDPMASKWINDVNLYFKKIQTDDPV